MLFPFVFCVCASTLAAFISSYVSSCRYLSVEFDTRCARDVLYVCIII